MVYGAFQKDSRASTDAQDQRKALTVKITRFQARASLGFFYLRHHQASECIGETIVLDCRVDHIFLEVDRKIFS